MDFGDGIGGLKQALGTVVPANKPQAMLRAETRDGAGNSAPDSATQVDEASLSKASGLITKALELPDVRAAKVEALQQAIANGSYNVSSSAVADKIIQSLTE
jgi:flagellar biosynthesis anti-sigma factor FlgM